MHRFRKILGYLLLITTCCIFGPFSTSHAESLWFKLEKEIGFTSYQQLLREKQILRLTPGKQRQLQQIFADLTVHSKRNTEINFSLTVVADPEINAYALPGGYVIVNTGLLEFADGPGELAAALAHEIGHIDCKHGINAISRTIGLTLALQLLANRTDHPDRLKQLGAVAIVLSQKGYSRSAEYQADQTGARLLEVAGYSPHDMVRFFHKLEQQSSCATSRFFLWKLIDTHPPFPERIKRIRQRQTGDFFSK
jgi:predicted Zn-dependent protease